MVKPWETDLALYGDEAELLAGLRRKDRDACTCLLKRYAPRFYRLALQLTGDADVAEDVLQEAFVHACANVDAFEGRSGLGTWLHRIVRNTALARLRRRPPPTVPLSGAGGEPADGEGVTLVDPGAGPGEVALAGELGEALARAVLALPAALRAAFVLRDVEGLSTKEAAEALGIAESALKVRLHRARSALRGALAVEAVSAESTGERG